LSQRNTSNNNLLSSKKNETTTKVTDDNSIVVQAESLNDKINEPKSETDIPQIRNFQLSN